MGEGSENASGLPTLLQIDCGTIYTLATSCRLAYSDVENLTVTWFPDTTAPVSGSPYTLMSGYFIRRLYVKATSLAVSGVPFDHFTPVRIVNTIDLPPAPHVNALASHLYGADRGFAVLNWSRGS